MADFRVIKLPPGSAIRIWTDDYHRVMMEGPRGALVILSDPEKGLVYNVQIEVEEPGDADTV